MHLGGGVAFVGVISIGHSSPFMGKKFQVQDRHRWTTLLRGRNCEEGRHMALIFILYNILEQNSFNI